ncbi:pyridoxal phosphate-dependent decarboxylase family protein [Rathayibacter soli]|uniref:pyridoxal phosphate-dependent decarboxylase family protein n=1 Tax=Rathayibacter soli TaxID=3144168 RepID=UPI003907EAE5
MRAGELRDAFGGALPDEPTDAATVVDELATLAEPGLMAMQSGRFYGWVTGGTLPAALGADWLVTAWDQNAALRFATPAVVAAEEAAAGWLLDLLGLPSGCDVGFTTGATMSNFVGLAAARQEVLARAGWNVAADGLTGAPRLRVFVGADRHTSIDLALNYLGLGAPIAVAADDQGRILPAALAEAMDGGTASGAATAGGPAIVCLQAGNVHSGAFDPMAEAIEVAHERGAWVHVDGAFGLWAAASPRLRDRLSLAGVEAADSWTTDAHKTLNVPYDCGIAIVARPETVRTVFGTQASYLMADDPGPGDPFERVPEFSRRARGVPVWAALRSLGRRGTIALVERFAEHATAFADGIARIPGAEVINDVVFTQVCVSFGEDERTKRVTERLLAGGVTWMSGSRWRDRDVLRISVSNWSTDAADVAKSLAALERAAAVA